MEIIVIGTEPPCIRCHTTFKRAKEVARQFSEGIEVKKVAIHTEAAEKYGNVEAGHGIGEAGNIKPDFEKMITLMRELDELKADEEKNESLIDAGLKDLEKVLAPVKEKARELGFLMTPVLVINGQVKSMDYVPSKEEIRAWIEIESKS
ncbi:MAG TPA: thioredoxin family protein [Dehalococcoidales bacterium]|nr:thioredoxin family protein [Dehalococcoidales bacterium]